MSFTASLTRAASARKSATVSRTFVKFGNSRDEGSRSIGTIWAGTNNSEVIICKEMAIKFSADNGFMF